jgi:hypothetical protein
VEVGGGLTLAIRDCKIYQIIESPPKEIESLIDLEIFINGMQYNFSIMIVYT